mgnify:CR=1 FL=1
MSEDDTLNHKILELEQQKLALKEINEYLEKQSSQQTQILDSLSHDLRTPLVIIKSYVDMILDEKFGKITSQQYDKLKNVQENIDLLIDAIFSSLMKKDISKS